MYTAAIREAYVINEKEAYLRHKLSVILYVHLIIYIKYTRKEN
jgi:hypothetical protein